MNENGYHMPEGMWQQVVDAMRETRMPVLINGHPRYPLFMVWLSTSYQSR